MAKAINADTPLPPRMLPLSGRSTTWGVRFCTIAMTKLASKRSMPIPTASRNSHCRREYRSIPPSISAATLAANASVFNVFIAAGNRPPSIPTRATRRTAGAVGRRASNSSDSLRNDQCIRPGRRRCSCRMRRACRRYSAVVSTPARGARAVAIRRYTGFICPTLYLAFVFAQKKPPPRISWPTIPRPSLRPVLDLPPKRRTARAAGSEQAWPIRTTTKPARGPNDLA